MDFLYQVWINSLCGVTIDFWKYGCALDQSVQSNSLEVQRSPRLYKNAQLLKAVEYWSVSAGNHLRSLREKKNKGKVSKMRVNWWN